MPYRPSDEDVFAPPPDNEEEEWDDIDDSGPSCQSCGDSEAEFCESYSEYFGEDVCLDSCCACDSCVDCDTHVPWKATLEQYYSYCNRVRGVSREEFTSVVLTDRFGARCTWRTHLAQAIEFGEVGRVLCPHCLRSRANTIRADFPVTEYEEQPDDETVVKPQWVRRNGSNEMCWHNQNSVHFWQGADCAEMPDVFVGVEIECDRGGSSKLRDKVIEWKSNVRADGSVSAGFEIATAPASGDKFVQMVNEITEECKKAHGLITPRCGLHIHVDCRDLDDQKRLLLTGLWCLFEHHFISMMPPSRRGQNRVISSYYCKPLSPRWRAMQGVAKGTETPEQMLGFLLTRRFAAPDYYSGDRYKAWNLMALGKYQTIECRLHSGTLQPEKIIPWASILASLKLAVTQMTPDQLVAHLSQPRPTRELLLELLWSDQCRDYVVQRQETFKQYNTPDALVAMLNPITEYCDALASITE